LHLRRQSYTPTLTMQSFALPLAALSLAAAPSAPLGSTKEIDRSHIDDRYKWKLGDSLCLGPGLGQSQGRPRQEGRRVRTAQGHLGDGPKALADALVDLGTLQNELQRIAVYAHARSDENTRLAAPRAMRAEADSLGVQLDTVTSWLRPELLTLPSRPFRRRWPRTSGCTNGPSIYGTCCAGSRTRWPPRRNASWPWPAS